MDMRRPLCERTAQYVQVEQKKSGWNRGEQSSLMRMITYQGLFCFTGKFILQSKNAPRGCCLPNMWELLRTDRNKRFKKTGGGDRQDEAYR
jgi:hypothetical protein